MQGDRLSQALDPPAKITTGAGRVNHRPARHTRSAGRTHIRARTGWQLPPVRELWHSRELIALFAARDITVRYRQTFFGVLWAVFVPVAQMTIFTVFFGHALSVSGRVNAAAGQALPYPLFALSGLIVWNVFKASLDGASTSLLVHAHILRKVYVPRLALPLAALGRPGLDAAIAFILLLGVASWYVLSPGSGIAVTPAWLAAPLLLLGAAIAGLALGLILAALSINYRDLQHVLPFLTSLLFFVTPVIYSVDLLPPQLAILIHLNPVVGFVEAHRAVVMGLPFDGVALAVSTGLTLFLLGIGVLYFARVERQFADVA